VNILAALILIVVSLFMLVQLRMAHSFTLKLRVPAVLLSLLFFYAYIKVVLQYLVPGILRLFSDFEFERMDHISPWSVVRLYTVEFISWSFYLAALIFTLGYLFRKNEKLNAEEFIKQNLGFAKKFILLCGAGLCLIIFASVGGEIENPLFVVVRSLFFYCGLGAGPLMLLLSGKYFHKYVVYLGLFVTGLGSFAIGTRGAIVYMVFFIFFVTWEIKKDHKTKRFLIWLISILIIGYAVTGGVPTVPIGLADTGEVTIELKSNSDKSEGRSKLGELDWRFGAATRLGTKFFDMYDRGDSAGINPIKHSLMGFLPRAIVPDKPIPSTLIPDDIYSQGMYLIYRETYGYDTYSMSEFPTGAHFYWEFGLLGVLLLSALSACYIAVSIKLFSGFGLASIPLLLATFKPWGYMEPKIWISDAVLQVYQIILPTFLIYFLYKAFCFFKKKIVVKNWLSKN
jgi:hypothetical protein